MNTARSKNRNRKGAGSIGFFMPNLAHPVGIDLAVETDRLCAFFFLT